MGRQGYVMSRAELADIKRGTEEREQLKAMQAK